MEIEQIISLISTVGFPIVMCLMFFKYMRDDINKLSETVNNNTLVIQKLLDKMDGESDV